MIALYEVYPPVSGAASVSYHLARNLPGETVLIQLTRRTGHPDPPPDIRTIGFRYASDRHLSKLLSVGRRLPAIARAVKAERPDAVILEGASWAVYLLMVLSTLRMAGVRVPIVYHSHNVEYVLRKERNGPVIARLTRWAEGHLCRRSDLASAVSAPDARTLEALYGLAPVLLPNGVDPDRFAVSPDEAARVASKYGIAGRTVLFMGLPDYPPNREAIEALVARILPAARRSLPELRLAVIGGPIPMRHDWLLNPGCIPHTDVPGFVKACALCVAPIRSGSGTRVKLLEYMAAARPVVSTTKGAEGLGAVPGRHLLIADSDEDCAEAIVRLSQDALLAGSLGNQALAFVRERFSWKSIADDLAGRIRALIGRRKAESSRTESPEGVPPHGQA